jgi:hypothetical protein
MPQTELANVNTIMDIVNSYTSLDAQAKYIWAAKTLARKCPFFQDMPMRPSNQIFSNIGVRQSYLATPGTRRFNSGVAPTKSIVTPFTEQICMIEDYSDVDKALCDIQPNPETWRQERDAMKLEAMTHKAEDQIIYGSIGTDPAAINGFATRFNSLSYYPNGDTSWPLICKSAGGSSSVTSIFVVQWGEGKVFGIYPQNLPAGIKVEDLGEQTAVASDSPLTSPAFYQAYRSHLAVYFGINVEDERCVQRYCNIEQSGSSNIFDPEHLVEVINRLPDPDGAVIYVSRGVKTQMDIAAMNKSNGFYTVDSQGDIFGRPLLRFRGIPVRMADRLTTETAVS